MREAEAMLGMLRRGWWAGALVVVATLVATGAFTSRQAPVYRSSGTVVVKPDPSLVETADVLRSLEALERRTILATFAELAVSARVKAAAVERAALTPEYGASFTVASSILPNTNIIRISVQGPESLAVATLARHIGAVLATEAKSLYTPFVLEALSEAAPGARPAFPDPKRNMVVGLVVGLFLGALATFTAARPGALHASVPLVNAARAHAAR